MILDASYDEAQPVNALTLHYTNDATLTAPDGYWVHGISAYTLTGGTNDLMAYQLTAGITVTASDGYTLTLNSSGGVGEVLASLQDGQAKLADLLYHAEGHFVEVDYAQFLRDAGLTNGQITLADPRASVML